MTKDNNLKNGSHEPSETFLIDSLKENENKEKAKIKYVGGWNDERR